MAKVLVDIDKLFESLEKTWPFDVGNYFVLDQLPESYKRLFSFKHVLQHQMKACGRLAEIFENKDHEPNFKMVHRPDREIAEVAAKMVVNALRLAALTNTPPIDFEQMLLEAIKPQKPAGSHTDNEPECSRCGSIMHYAGDSYKCFSCGNTADL